MRTKGPDSATPADEATEAAAVDFVDGLQTVHRGTTTGYTTDRQSPIRVAGVVTTAFVLHGRRKDQPEAGQPIPPATAEPFGLGNVTPRESTIQRPGSVAHRTLNQQEPA
jgi:hypothetical protein